MMGMALKLLALAFGGGAAWAYVHFNGRPRGSYISGVPPMIRRIPPRVPVAQRKDGS
jgi:hypothetical protein